MGAELKFCIYPSMNRTVLTNEKVNIMAELIEYQQMKLYYFLKAMEVKYGAHGFADLNETEQIQYSILKDKLDIE